MLPEELIELARQVMEQKAETQTLEVKSAHQGCPKRLYDTLSSFSNQDNGGIILFGLDEKQDFKPVGVYDLHDLQQQVAAQCKGMTPFVRAIFTTAYIDDVPICSAEIPGLNLADRPCYYSGSGIQKGSYIRVGDADEPITPYEIYTYEVFRRHLHDDERIIDRADLNALNTEQVDAYIYKKQKDRPGFAQQDIDEKRKTLAIVNADGKPTLAALLNFGIYPQAYLPQLGITAVVVPGAEIGDTDQEESRFLDNKRIEGTIMELLEGALAFCRRNMKTRTIIDPETGERRDQTEYPLTAIREAILNAIIHRDYSLYTEGTPIQINFFSNRLEIHSPGTLYGPITVEQLGKVRPDFRNPTLAVMAESQIQVENRYSGIPTMRREMARCGLPAPQFYNGRNEFIVTFYNEPEEKKAVSPNTITTDTKNPESLLVFCQTPRSRTEIAQFLGIRTVAYAMSTYVTPMIKAGKLKLLFPETPRSRRQKYYSDR